MKGAWGGLSRGPEVCEPSLASALGLGAGELVSLVGGGGKTIIAWLLARELAAGGWRVLVTTTTRVFLPLESPGVRLLLDPSPHGVLDRVPAAMQPGTVLFWGGGILPPAPGDPAVSTRPKVAGIPPDLLTELPDRLSGLEPYCILVEADGAARKPLKAPAAHEPVIPAATTLVVAVVGLSVVGRTLAAAAVHRPELAARVAGVSMGEIVTPGLVARVIVHPDGLARGVPPGARFIAVLNQADVPAGEATGREIAGLLLEHGVKGVVVAAAATGRPVREVLTQGSPITESSPGRAGSGSRGVPR